MATTASGFKNRIGRSTALLIVDMVNPFDFEGADTLAGPALRAARQIRKLRERFDRAKAPVIYVNDNFMHWRGEFRDLLASCRSDGAAGKAIADLLQPGPAHYYVLKPKHSAFEHTALDVLLEKLKVQQIALAGIAADSCVLATALDAHSREFPLWLPADCTAAQSPQRKTRALMLAEDCLGADLSPAGR